MILPMRFHAGKKVSLLLLLPILLALLSMTQLAEAKEVETTPNRTGNEVVVNAIQAPVNNVFLTIDPQTVNVGQGELFTVTVQVQAGEQLIDGVSAYLDFDPNVLKSTGVIALNSFASEQKGKNDENGRVNYVGFTSPADVDLFPYPKGTFDLFHVRFRGKVEASTTISFHTEDDGRKTDVTAPDIGSVLTGSTGATAQITHVPIDAEFDCNNLNGDGPLAVKCTDGSLSYVTEWAWNFGDGTTGSGETPTHTYTKAGTYDVTLTVTGPNGTDTETKAGYVTVTSDAPVGGDCNDDGNVDAGDLSALVLEIFGGGSGNPPCDSNGDGTIDAADLSCTVLTIFNGAGACAAP